MLIPQILATMPKTTTIKNIIAPTTTANSLTNGINADNPNVIIVTQIKANTPYGARRRILCIIQNTAS